MNIPPYFLFISYTDLQVLIYFIYFHRLLHVHNIKNLKMKKLIFTGLAFIFALVIFQSCSDSISEETASDELSLKSASSGKSYIVVLYDEELNAELSNLKGYEKKQEAMKKASANILLQADISDGQIGHVYGSAIKGFSVKISPGQLKKLQDNPSVNYIEEDQIVSLIEPKERPSGKPGGGSSGGTAAQETPWGITRVGGAGDGTGKTAWIIDTGIDLDHPDLNVNSDRSINFVTRDNSPNDLNGHGTHVAGTIAALNNSIGVVGVAAGATVIAVRVLDRRGSGWTSDVIAGVDYVGANGTNGDVANMSLGGGASDALDKAVIAAATSGVKFALAAGNEGDDANNHSPARANGPNIYTISAMKQGDIMTSWSNYGNPPVDYCAPGSGITSTWKDGGYNTISGTSMAAPHAAGVLLLGAAKTNGYVSGDPDGNPDPIIHR